MLNQIPFFHDQFRRYQMVFGTLFNEINIQRFDASSNTIQMVKVPLSYASKDKLLARLFADPGIDRPTATVLPRMSFMMTGIRYNGNNKLGSRRQYSVVVTNDKNNVIEKLNPVPYDLKFTLWIFTKYIEDGNQIVEQIVPFFTPNFTATVNMMRGVDVDCQVALDSIEPQDMYADAFQKRRLTMWTMEFTVTGYLFGPERKHPLIKFADVEMIVPEGANSIQASDINTYKPIDRVTTQPGMDANGNPTTNVSLTVAYSQIGANDNWDYIVTIAGSLVPGDGSGGAPNTIPYQQALQFNNSRNSQYVGQVV